MLPANDPKYVNIPEAAKISTESLAVRMQYAFSLLCTSDDLIVSIFKLQTTLARVVPYWTNDIAPEVKKGKRVIIAAHGNSLRALVKYLDNISDKEITELNIPTGVPLVYELDQNLKPIPHKDAIGPLTGRYIGNQEDIRNRIMGVAVSFYVIMYLLILFNIFSIHRLEPNQVNAHCIGRAYILLNSSFFILCFVVF